MSKLIMTHHATERKWQRWVSQSMIQKTVDDADGSKRESDGDTQFYKTINGRKVHVVAHPQRNGDWLIKTVWVNGEDDPNPLWKALVTVVVRIARM